MGQEISQSHFDGTDFDRFHRKLTTETQQLTELFKGNNIAHTNLIACLEIEARLVDENIRPAPLNEHYSSTVNEPLTSAELAKFNIELNAHPLAINGTVFTQLYQQLQTTWENVDSHAKSLQSVLVMIGILPTLHPSDLAIKNMSDLNRYQVLNEQIFSNST